MDAGVNALTLNAAEALILLEPADSRVCLVTVWPAFVNTGYTYRFCGALAWPVPEFHEVWRVESMVLNEPHSQARQRRLGDIVARVAESTSGLPGVGSLGAVLPKASRKGFRWEVFEQIPPGFRPAR